MNMRFELLWVDGRGYEPVVWISAEDASILFNSNLDESIVKNDKVGV